MEWRSAFATERGSTSNIDWAWWISWTPFVSVMLVPGTKTQP